MITLLVSEKRVWFTLDQLATNEALVGGNPSKRSAFEDAMGYLEAPTPEECRRLYEESERCTCGVNSKLPEMHGLAAAAIQEGKA